MMGQTLLVTGATGYIGSHTCVCLLQAGWRVVAIDNFSNSSPAVVSRIELVADREMRFHALDVRDHGALLRLLQREAVVANMPSTAKFLCTSLPTITRKT